VAAADTLTFLFGFGRPGARVNLLHGTANSVSGFDRPPSAPRVCRTVRQIRRLRQGGANAVGPEKRRPMRIVVACAPFCFLSYLTYYLRYTP
jgi:hypothetical protein